MAKKANLMKEENQCIESEEIRIESNMWQWLMKS
jgi:hypothetical protein